MSPTGLARAAGQRLRKAAAAAPLLVLTACSQLPQSGPDTGTSNYAGRFSLSIEAGQEGSGSAPGQSSSGRFDLVTGAGHARIDLLSPLGATLARFEIGDDGASLAVPRDGQVRIERDADPARLSERVLGWALPLQDLTAWIRAMPDASRPSRAFDDDLPASRHFEQDGWEVQSRSEAGSLRLRLHRAAAPGLPAISLRVVLDAGS